MRQPIGGLFENAVLINLLSGMSAFKKISGWKKGNTGIEVDFVMDTMDVRKKVPIECKASTLISKKHYKNLIHYLTATSQKFGVLVSAAPFEIINSKEDITIMNLPCYLASRKNIENYLKLYS